MQSSIAGISDDINEINIKLPYIVVEDVYNEYNTRDTSFGADFNASVGGGSTYLSGSHCPSGIISSVSFECSGGGNGAILNTSVYLIAEIYNSANTLISKTCSLNSFIITNTSGVYNTWNFDNLNAPGINEYIKFYPSTDKNTYATGCWIPFRYDATHTHPNCGFGDNIGLKGLVSAKFTGNFYHPKSEQPFTMPFTVEEKTLLANLGERAGTYMGETLLFDNIKEGESHESEWQPATGFTLARPRFQNGIFSKVAIPYSRGSRASTSNITLVIDLRDKRNALIKRIYSTDTYSYPDVLTGVAEWHFSDFQITDEVSYLIFRV